MAACQWGLLLVTPAFLTSKYITQHELPLFVGDNTKPLVPVMLKTIDLQRHHTKGIEEYQLFRLNNVRSLADCTSDGLRRRFVEQLFVQIERRLNRLFAKR